MSADVPRAPTLMDPQQAARVLEASLRDPRTPLTLADAAAQSGLALRDAERGLHWLTSSYRGHLRVTDAGDLMFVFPDGFTRPWEGRDRVRAATRAIGRGLGAAARFTMRAWLTIVMLVYVAGFVAVLVALLFASSSNSSDRSSSRGRGGAGILEVVLRVVLDAMYWTFHPFSPVRAAYPVPDRARDWRRDRDADETPFYAKVDRFVFGPEVAHEDPREVERRVLAEIRAQKGRVGVADVMRVTGLSREAADPMMARLMLDYDGEVHVSDAGGIWYSFESLRLSTARPGTTARPAAAWEARRATPPLTGNAPGSNITIAALNAFNAVMALVSMSLGLTVGNVVRLFQHVPLQKLPWDGTPVVLGIVPLLFSLMVFAVPVARAVVRPLTTRADRREKARLAMLREVLERSGRGEAVTEQTLSHAYERAAGTRPKPGELTRVVVDLGGDVEPDQGQVRYRFAELEAEAEALAVEREAARESEAIPGPIVFASDR